MSDKSNAQIVKVREFALLLNGGDKSDVDCHSITSKAFEWLLVNGQSSNEKAVELVKVRKYGKAVALQVVNYVGVLETPCGMRIEILPKVSEQANALEAKKILLKMLSTVNKLPLQQFEQSALQTLKQPLYEILIGYFLREVSKLVKRGIRSEYQIVNDRKPYLKGKLQTAKQIRQRPGCQNKFHVSYDQFSTDRAENRLIKSALVQVMKWTKSNENHRIGRELQFALDDIPVSTNHVTDFRKWSTDRALVHYRGVKPWCELILSYQSPIALSGSHKGISFLFPMEILFERYVAIKLQEQLPADFTLKSQASSQSLVQHCPPNSNNVEGWFKLKPDIQICNKATKAVVCIADTKWKRIYSADSCSTKKYNISQSDMYQLFAYGEKFLNGQGILLLIYPKHGGFTEGLAPFKYKEGLNLHAVPYDLMDDSCDIQLTELEGEIR
ncbi:McrC family protein [Vibrio aestuarianus]|uniref:McrC family protein n=1 Tax=Vibrio aestuarianus TaxID=28171 RepID=UPI00237D1883|nr:McrC family protein [Vibrio aestuarianus]MDE1348539.1 McrC family protein [Vibrio aestuarianus]